MNQSQSNVIPKPPKDKGLVSQICYWLAVGLGSGLAPKAPGTVGTLASLLFFPLFLRIPLWLCIVIILMSCILGVFICGRAADDMQMHDSGHIVWDEWAGQWLAMSPLIYLHNSSFIFIGVSFALFRFFDILKPFPIGWLDKKVSGGLGIMLDDIIAGIFSAICLTIMIFAVWM